MNKDQFLVDLRKKLKQLPKDEINNAINYYEDYFEDSNKNEEDVIKELGSPSLIASQILGDYAIQGKTTNSSLGKKILIIILAILAASGLKKLFPKINLCIKNFIAKILCKLNNRKEKNINEKTY